MEIYIDDVRMDTDRRTVVSLNLAIASISEPEKSRTGYSNGIVLPVTDRNRRVMGGSDQVNAAVTFNRTAHRAVVLQDGCVVMEGSALLLSASVSGGGGEQWPCYRIGLLGGGKAWADMAAATMIRSLDMEFGETITASTLLRSWTWDHPVRFLPVERDGFAVENHSANLISPHKVLAFEDYHPFIRLKPLMDRIFEMSGYRLKSEFMEGDFFGKLHISGNYPSKSSAAAKARMDFLAGRFGVATASADSLGRVYANPYLSYSTVGNLVETADPEEMRDGVKLAGLYNKGGCFRYDDDRIAFVPNFEVTAAFEYRIFYTTGYRITSRDRLEGFDSVNLDDGQGTRPFALSNRYEDRRREFVSRKTYTLVVFDHTEGNTYRFAYDEIIGGNPTLKIHSEFSGRTLSVTVDSAYAVAAPQLYLKDYLGVFRQYEGDWALYDGYVQETGTLEVELKIRSSAERLLPSRPKYFDSIFFGGAAEGTVFILGDKTTVRPVFAEYPTIGSRVSFEDVAAHDFTCLDLVKGVKHLFNLRFYTDPVSGNVYAEPYPEFYWSEPVIDWSGKIDFSRPVVIREPAEKVAGTIHYCYRSGDGAVARQNVSRGETLGRWTVRIDNNLAKKSEQTVENPIFTASVNSAGNYPDAVAASLVQAGDRDSTLSDDLEDLCFLPKIVVYEGMRPLPEGQKWGWPFNGPSYPYLSFHHTDADNTGTGDIEPFTLCFEDRDGISGLHRYRDKETRQVGAGKRIEIYLDLTPDDVEPLIRPGSLTRDFRGLFRLTIGGESALYRLEEISGYEPSSNGPTKCVFLKEFPVG